MISMTSVFNHQCSLFSTSWQPRYDTDMYCKRLASCPIWLQYKQWYIWALMNSFSRGERRPWIQGRPSGQTLTALLALLTVQQTGNKQRNLCTLRPVCQCFQILLCYNKVLFIFNKKQLWQRRKYQEESKEQHHPRLTHSLESNTMEPESQLQKVPNFRDVGKTVNQFLNKRFELITHNPDASSLCWWPYELTDQSCRIIREGLFFRSGRLGA